MNVKFRSPIKRRVIENRVLHLSSAHPWTDNRIHAREALSLKDAGFDVGLYAVTSDQEMSTTLKVAKGSKLPRLLRMSVGTARALRVALSSRAGFVHVHDPELIWTIPIIRLAGSLVIYDAHEDLPSQVMDKAYLPGLLRRPSSFVAQCLVAFADMNSDWIIAATEKVAERFDQRRTTVVRNFPHAPIQTKRDSQFENHTRSAVYVGGISEARGVEAMVDAFASDNLPTGWHLELAGHGTDSYLSGLTGRPGWDKVNFHGQILPQQARDLIAKASVGICTLKDTVAYRDALPTKMFEYMAEGIPVIASDFPLWRSIVKGYDCGLLVDPDSPEQIANALGLYSNDEDLLRSHGANGQKAAQRVFNWTVEAERLVGVYLRLSSRGDEPSRE